MSRVVAALLLVTMLLLASGCGSSDNGAGGEPSTGSSAGDAAFGKKDPDVPNSSSQGWDLQPGGTVTPSSPPPPSPTPTTTPPSPTTTTPPPTTPTTTPPPPTTPTAPTTPATVAPVGSLTQVFTAMSAETGTVTKNGGADTSLTRAGDDAANESFRAFWSFDLQKLHSTDVQEAILSFTHKQTVGDPFSLENLQLGIGGIRVWIVRYEPGSLPKYDTASVQELTVEPLRESPTEYDLTLYVQRIGQNLAVNDLVQIMVGFQRVTNNDSVADFVEWDKAVLTVTYAPA